MTIYYVQPSDELAVGGLAQAYRHVAILVQEGFDARILFLSVDDTPPPLFASLPYASLENNFVRRRLGNLPRIGRRFFSRSKMAEQIVDDPRPGLPIVLAKANGRRSKTSLSASDIVVLPEFYGVRLRATASSVPVVVFNQGPHLSFRGAESSAQTHSIYRDPIMGVITVSDYAESYLRYAFPGVRLFKTPNAVDQKLFRFSSTKKKQLAFMPRKLPQDLAQILSLLSFRDLLDGWKLCPIENSTPAQVAETLQDSRIFLSTLSQEGFGLPPLEAALCGCVVVGYTGFAASEFMDPKYCFPVPERDVLSFAKTLEEVIFNINLDEEKYASRCREFALLLSSKYAEERQREAVLATWKELLSAA